MAALAEHGGGHGYRAAAREALSLLEQRGWSLVRADPFAAASQRAGLLAALGAIELTGEEGQHDHNYETGCQDYTTIYARPVDAVTDDLLAELKRRGWSLVQADPFATAKPPSGCCGGWVGPDGQRSMCCPAVTDMFAECASSTDAPAIGGADAEPPNLAERLEYVEAIVLGRDGPSVLDTLAERLMVLEGKLATWIPQEQA